MTDTTTKQRVSKYWRSLDELENSPEFQEFVHREFPQAASELPEGISRRRWMQLMGASFTLAAAQGCRWQTEKFAAFADRPEGYVPGATTKYATSIELAGAPKHLLVSCIDGRPVKVEGNSAHPSTPGGADAFAQATTLSLYDPDRQEGVIRREGSEATSSSWGEFEKFAFDTVKRLSRPDYKRSLAILMQPVASLSVKAAIERIKEALPETKVFEFSPLSRDNELMGAETAFGKKVRTHYRLASADVIACFDADLLQSFPEAGLMSRAYADRREPDAEKNPAGMNRLYAVESQFSVTGAAADHRLAIKSSSIPAFLAKVRDAVAGRLEGQSPAEPEGDYEQKCLFALADDLVAAKGKSVVAVGPGQPPVAHAIAHEMNAMLGNVGQTVEYTEEPGGDQEVGKLTDLIADLAIGQVDTLLVMGGNPIYDSPANRNFAEHITGALHTIHLSEYDNETSRACEWSLPETHPFEAWGDTPAWDGTVGVAQPLIEPLLDGRSALQVLSLMAEGPDSEITPKQRVREAIEAKVGDLDDDSWEKLLHDGYVEGGPKPVDAVLVRTAFEAPAAPAGDPLELVFTPSSHTYDGRFANNGWLQETPDFITKLTWDNAALIAPETAQNIGVKQGELLSITVSGNSVEAPVFLQPGQAPGSIGLALGYGRTAAGRVGGMVNEDGSKPRSEFVVGLRGNWSLFAPAAEPVGFDSYKIRTSDGMDIVTDVQVKPTGRNYLLATTQDHHAIDELGLEETVRRSGELIREAKVEDYLGGESDFHHVGAHVPDVELWDELSHNRPKQGAAANGEPEAEGEGESNRHSVDGRAWGMAIDLNKCLGCNACSVACQAENNVPVVGKDQVARGREMHWIRIDRYFIGDKSHPRVSHQPLTCQHCETAPCEQVCPVAATVHSDEGLNDMAYNRCIGTRYCANNCPFKVRRFNFFHYTDRFDRANNELMRLVMNPEVTVRSRGVMEKCTFCTQRISAARIAAKNEHREVRDGEVRTACQEACSTNAIVFGDLNDPESEVAAWNKSGRAYTLLDGLRLKPRTTYLGRIFNPHKLLEPYMNLATEFNPAHGHGHGGEGHDGEGHHNGDGHHKGDGHSDGEGHSNEPPESGHAAHRRSKTPLGSLPIIG